MSVIVNDDYAVLNAGSYQFYYGYEYRDDYENWRFVVIKDDKIIFSGLPNVMGCDESSSTAEILLAGIGRFIQRKVDNLE